ncbi:CRE-TTR-54 protein [Caenorhabditis remanei]|uniref:CRE-TTR-54 protein n=1 Tax=Caenorhabditis remanei TaxID=31234 RepID=E3MM33_CAERE|nr:CRE-TTR-54 protein [Caenorhabditis remanei]
MRVHLTFLLCCSSALLCSAANNCAWFVGQLQCSDPSKLENIVVEIWDRDRSFVSFHSRDFIESSIQFPLTLFVDDDLAGRTITSADDNGTFKVEGCASDVDFLFLKNEPEFYLKIRHYCKGSAEVTYAHPRDMKVFVPETNDYFTRHPIKLG